MVDGGTTERSRPAVCAPVARLASIPAGPALAAALAQVALPALTGYEAVLVLRARRRQANHEQAMLLAAVDEVLRRDDPGFGRVEADQRGEWSGVDEVRAALVLTRPGAKSLCDVTTELVTRLPDVFAAMAAGVLDEARGRLFSSGTAGLRPEHRQAVVDALLPRAPRMTTAELADAIRKAAIELDPEGFRRRYEKALTRRRVEAMLDADGTGSLSGRNLPAEQVNAAIDRLDGFARRLKHAGHPDGLDMLRADVFGGLLDGSLAGLDDEEILERLLADRPPTPADDSPEDEPAASMDAVVDSAPPAGEPSGFEPPRRPPVRIRGRGLRLVAGLGTIAGRDQRSGVLLGLGSVHAELARRISAAERATWRYVLREPGGELLDVGLIRRRPGRDWSPGPAPGYEGIEVWLQLTRAQLAALRADPPPGWAAVLAELADRIATRSGGPPNGDPHDRFPNAELRRWVQIRDLHCTFPGCRVSSHHSEVDHLRDYLRGGPTIDANLGSACPGDHRAKTKGGWVARATVPGRITWRSPLGHDYGPAPPG